MEIIKDVEPDVQKAVRTILSVFGGEDGGGSFARLAGMINDLDKQSKNGDVHAKKILDIVKQFGRLCELNLQSTIDKRREKYNPS